MYEGLVLGGGRWKGLDYLKESWPLSPVDVGLIPWNTPYLNCINASVILVAIVQVSCRFLPTLLGGTVIAVFHHFSKRKGYYLVLKKIPSDMIFLFVTFASAKSS